MRSSTLRVLVMAALMTGSCTLLATPASAVVLVLDIEETCENHVISPDGCASVEGCNDSHGPGWGFVNGIYRATGMWINGCGGRHCDDKAEGVIDGSSWQFEIVEARTAEGCFVYCELKNDEFIYNSFEPGTKDSVKPSKQNGIHRVDFECSLFYGYLSK